MPSTMPSTLYHPELGPLQGYTTPSKKTTEYRNIKYASISSRFQDPLLLSYAPSSTNQIPKNCTTFGPSCPQHPAGFTYDVNLIGEVPEMRQEMNRRKSDSLSVGSSENDELECLNLVVAVPEGNFEGSLPVVVWVHGGGFSVGGNSWPQYDLSNLVSESVGIGKPVIAVSINYRVGLFGFLASSELGLSGNLGLKDQICAFKWIWKYISGLGGDPERVSAIGESAGSICLSTLLHINHSEPLFSKAILMSGDPTLRRPRDMKWQDSHYQSIITALGLQNLTPKERIEEMLTMHPNEIVDKLPAFMHWSPTIDNTLITDEITVGNLLDPNHRRGKPEWCKKVIVGSAAHDGTCLHTRLLALPLADLLARIHTSLAQTFAPNPNTISLNATTHDPILRILEAYSLPLPNHVGELNAQEIYKNALDLISDLRFNLPSRAMRRGFAERGGRYEFHQQNPTTNSLFTGMASHELEISFLFQNYAHFLVTPEARTFVRGMSEVVLGFVYDEPPATVAQEDESSEGDRERREKEKEKEIIVFGPDYKIKRVEEQEYDRLYRGCRGALWDSIGWERWFELGERVQGCI
ncbi:alpha/beta-Hydrolase [Glarea lozoyensis ATCC 20868]|uniref:Alpha/beta-Hydrolase n=1 Tax=Glarea lozoyensis (strain ATCC 20868 / MF5171) TaxID=1116229 RepID=S3D2R4_GLAL2|nr:alpha/beta-Hydrolase [Glarea lozoyensis ATCC 20868]EPE26321.1 alpha/beta-Hydrolase [Glarea lozoyensis ATCC 20868]